MQQELDLGLVKEQPNKRPPAAPRSLPEELAGFSLDGGQPTRILKTPVPLGDGRQAEIDTYVNEFWTARQRAAHSLNEISYRACFKPQLPRFFIERLTQPGSRVYDPFMGRGTSLLEAALLGRVPVGNDINPLSLTMIRPRLNPPQLAQVTARLQELDLSQAPEWPEELLVFYHPHTLREIVALKFYFLERLKEKALDPVDDWIRMVAINRLTGHSAGFFSVYSLPPNQAVSVKSQTKINERLKQAPPLRDVRKIITKKSQSLLADLTVEETRRLARCAQAAQLLNEPAEATPQIAADSVALAVTSPPFLAVVDYALDNWLRCWFLGIDPKSVKISTPRSVKTWREIMTRVFHELFRVVQPGGHVAFEVGEVHRGQTRLEEVVLPCGIAAGFSPELVLINDQKFTKTAHCWGVGNNAGGTNTNRIVLFRKKPLK